MKKAIILFLKLFLVLIMPGCGIKDRSLTKKMISAIDEKDYLTIETIASNEYFNINQKPYANSMLPRMIEQWNLPPLHYACLRGEFEAVKILIDNGADINLMIDSMTPLMYCAHTISTAEGMKILSLLIENGANVSLKDKYDNSVLDYIFYGGYNESFEKNQFECFMKIIKIDSSLAYEELKYKDSVGSGNFLHKVVYFNNSLVANYLIMHLSFDVDKLNNDKETSLMIAAKLNNYEVAKALCENGANVALKNGDGKTALDLAIQYNSDKIIELFKEIEKG